MNQQKLNKIIASPQILERADIKEYMLEIPKSSQQMFYQTIMNLLQLRSVDIAPGDKELDLVLNQFEGPFCKLILKGVYTDFLLKNGIDLKRKEEFSVNTQVLKWSQQLRTYLKADKFSFMASLVSELRIRHLDNFEDCIMYLDHIAAPGLLSLLRGQSSKEEKEVKQEDIKDEEAGEKEIQDQESKDQRIRFKSLFQEKLHQRIDVHDLLSFITGVLPKVYFNTIVPRAMFPDNYFYKSQDLISDRASILYRNENIEMLIKNCKNYAKFIKISLAYLLNSTVEGRHQTLLLQSCFHYYFLFHNADKQMNSQKEERQFYFAEEFVLEGIKKISFAVRFAMADEIMLFITVLKKLGKHKFIDRLRKQSGQWFQSTVLQKVNQTKYVGHLKEQLIPFPAVALSLSQQIRVSPGGVVRRYFQIFHPYTLLYFKIRPTKDDITIRLFNLGDFETDGVVGKQRIIFAKERMNYQHMDCIQIVRPGIYMFQFDNSYSWIKGKVIIFDRTELVPMEIVEDQESLAKKAPWLKVIFGHDHHSVLAEELIIRRVGENEDKKNLAEKLAYKTHRRKREILSLKVSFKPADKVYNLYLIEKWKENETKSYEYESKDPQLFKNKLTKLRFDVAYELWVYGKRVSSMEELLSSFESQKAVNSLKPEEVSPNKPNYEQIQQE